MIISAIALFLSEKERDGDFGEGEDPDPSRRTYSRRF
jgi:hypothetical protein